jgi:hypothetical protein
MNAVQRITVHGEQVAQTRLQRCHHPHRARWCFAMHGTTSSGYRAAYSIGTNASSKALTLENTDDHTHSTKPIRPVRR